MHQMVRLFKSEMNAKGHNETQIQHTTQSSIAGSTNGVDMSMVGERNLIQDISHGSGEIKCC